MKFGWDPNKAASNRRKHGISFENAARVFLDPLAIREQDQIVDGEERWQIIGTYDHIKLIVVAHTTSDDESGEEVIRIISARKVERHERQRYEG